MNGGHPTGLHSPDSIGLYVHIPYCVSKCPYCDFNSYAISDPGTGSRRTAPLEEKAYTAALLQELEHYAAKPEWQNRLCHSIFFGGGTPSLFSAEAIAVILNSLTKLAACTADCEITLETNPGTVAEALGLAKLQDFRHAGVNRISFGAQSFSPEKLKTLGRLHSVSDIKQSFENARVAGFENINLDLIFGVPGETAQTWQSDLDEALRFSPEHLSAYCLTIEPGTEFDTQQRKGVFKELPDSLQAELFEHTQTTLSRAGYEQYEISNYAKPGKACRHNVGYWDWSDYLSLGAGAHSFVKHHPRLDSGHPQNAFLAAPSATTIGQRWSNIPKPAHYVERANAGGDCSQRREEINSVQAELEYLLCRVRTAAGIDESEFRSLFGSTFCEKYAAQIAPLIAEQLLRSTPSRTAVTPRGFLFVDEILLRLSELADLPSTKLAN